MANREFSYGAYIPALKLEAWVSGRWYRLLNGLLLVWLVGCLVMIAATVIIVTWGDTASTTLLGITVTQWTGAFLLGASVFLVCKGLHYFYTYYYFSGLDTLLEGTRASAGAVYEVAAIFYSHSTDVTAGFLTSSFGRTWVRRLGLTDEQVTTFIASPRTGVSVEMVQAGANGQVTLSVLVVALIECDQAFAAWLQTAGVTADVMNGALVWTYYEHLERKRQARWWSRDNLSKVRGIGRDFAYGFTNTLDHFTKPIGTGVVYAQHTADPALAATYIEAIETALVRDRNANVLLVGPAGVGKLDLLVTVGTRLEAGESIGAVSGTQLVLLDTEILTATTNDKATYELTFLKVLDEAARAGNVILVIDKFDAVIENARQLGVDLAGLMDTYLASPQLHVIATVDQQAYHASIESQAALVGRFNTIFVTPPDQSAVLKLITTLATDMEARSPFRFTFAALQQVVESAERHIVSGVMPGKAVQLLSDVTAAAPRTLITKTDVQQFVAEKTGIPVGPIGDTERDLLLQLEDVLHQRVVGQDRAVAAISGVMRRSRADIHDTQKPIGSFLFLGPTGVGKTESAKALAAVFFKHEDAMHRLDMSEYSGADALARLIGDGQSAGALGNLLTEQPYAVLLLDEFEKADRSVHDLFLQILDEGLFTDATGRQVNVRNCIIIATSNAGSQLISEWVAAGESLDTKKDAIVSHLIDSQLYRPELINRFDDVVLFSPLSSVEQASIARLMLADLAERIAEKGYQLQVTDELVNALITIGYQPEFGARPMRRAIQEVVEEAVAEKIIAGTLQKGDTITFSTEELQRLIRGT